MDDRNVRMKTSTCKLRRYEVHKKTPANNKLNQKSRRTTGPLTTLSLCDCLDTTGQYEPTGH